MKKRNFLLFFILVCSILLRTFRFSQTLNLGTDQSMAYILANHILKYNHLLLVGPLTSFWEINLLPPIYYYLVTFLYLLLKSEVLVSFSFTIFGIIAIYFLYKLSKTYFNVKTALISAHLFSFSLPMIEYSRDIWEPHLVPFFIILSFYFFILFAKKEKIIFYYLSLTSFMISFMYVSSFTLLIPYLYISIMQTLTVFKNKMKSVLFSILSISAFLMLTYLPVLFFEATHRFPSLNIMLKALQGETKYLSANGNFLQKIVNNFTIIYSSATNNLNGSLNILSMSILILFILKKFLYFPDKNKNFKNLVIITFTPFILSGFYQQKAEIYRFASIYPFFYLLLSYFLYNFFNFLLSKKNYLIIIFFTIIITLIYFYPATIGLRKLIINRNHKLFIHADETVKEILKHSNWPFSMYIMTPYETQNHHGTSYYYALEKKLNRNIIEFNDRGNWINQNLNLKYKTIFLICKEFNNYTEASNYCHNSFKKLYKFKDIGNFTSNGDFIFKLNIAN